MKKRFQNDKWQRRYVNPEERRREFAFTVSAIVAVIAVGGAVFYAMAPSGVKPSPATSASLTVRR